MDSATRCSSSMATSPPPLAVSVGPTHFLGWAACSVHWHTDFPADSYVLDRVKPVYETLPGWDDELEGCASVAELPDAARAYVDFVERELDVAVTLVGTGAERESVLTRA